ncbi:MAG TPA: MFS transporter [Gemmatimonadales bacterium]|jgi:MFS family permease|nr:MFS transporter [Gemmatimonadales bacterium]
MLRDDARHDSYAALRHPGFRWFSASLLSQTLATQIQGVVVGWQVYQNTRDPLALGLVGLAEALPFLTMALFAGHVADRVSRRGLVLAALAVLNGSSLALLVFTVTGHVGVGSVWPVYAVLAASGVARSFLQPARTAMLSQLVQPPLYPNAVGWRTSVWQFGAVIGPALGGILYAIGGATLGYLVDAGLMVGAWATLVRVPSSPPPPAVATSSVLASLGEGLRFVWTRPVLLSALTLDLLAVLFGGAEALLPLFAAEILHVGPTGLGALRAAPAIGSVLTALVMAHRPPVERSGPALLAAVSVFGLSIIGFGFSRDPALSWLFLAIAGMADNVSVVLRATMLQVLTPPQLLGRVSAVNAIFIGSSNEIGAFESGVAAKLIGAVPAVVLGGVVTLLVVALTAWRVPVLRRLERIE